MVENVTIVDTNGNGIIATGIMHFKMKDTGKKYICYTLNETTGQGQVKIYVAETGNTVGIAGAIEENEWKEIKKMMVSIAHKEVVSNEEFIKMSGGTFYRGDVRKLQIEIPIKQALMDYQTANTLAVNTIEPTINENKPVFFDTSVVEEPVQVQTAAPSAINAFSMTADQTSVVPNEEPAPLTNIVSVDNSQTAVEEPAIVMEEPIQKIDTQVIDTRNNVVVTESVLQPEPTLEPPKEIIKNEEPAIDAKSVDTEMSYEQVVETVKKIDELMQEASTKMQEANKKIVVISDYLKKQVSKKEPEIDTNVELATNNVVPFTSEVTLEENPVIKIEPQAEVSFVDTASPNTIIDVAAPQIVMDTTQQNLDSTQFAIGDNNITNIQPGGIVDPTKNIQLQSVPVDATVVKEESAEMITSMNNLPQSEEVASYDTLQPTTVPPVEFTIPEVTLTAEPVQDEQYVHVAQGNNSAAVINYSDYQQDMPAVEMPLNYQNIDEAKSKMLEQGNLGPSGLSSDPQKTLGLVA